VRKINYLITLAKIKHFGRAAEACHVSQPTLSSAIQHLEDELGVTLFNRGQKFVGLTPQGEKILAHAQRLSSDWDALKQEAALCKQHLTGHLRIGAIPTTLAVVPLLTESYREKYPHLKFQIFSRCAEKIIQQLDAFELDFGLTYLNDQRLKGFKILPLYQERHVLLARHVEINEPQKPAVW
jgi:DNA-binding transcriptional LysR family regulator